jgi:hypothetical protein
VSGKNKRVWYYLLFNQLVLKFIFHHLENIDKLGSGYRLLVIVDAKSLMTEEKTKKRGKWK